MVLLFADALLEKGAPSEALSSADRRTFIVD
jgi:hypothetical protein